MGWLSVCLCRDAQTPKVPGCGDRLHNTPRQCLSCIAARLREFLQLRHGVLRPPPSLPPCLTALKRGQVPQIHSAAHCAAVRGPTHPARRALNNRHRHQSVCCAHGRSPARADPPWRIGRPPVHHRSGFRLKKTRHLGVFFLSLPHVLR